MNFLQNRIFSKIFRLAESFGQNYPEEFDGSLDCISLALTCTFNRYGTLLAVGCNDGRIVIWDFLTRGIAKIISAHVHPVCSLSWSRSGHKLLSASTDNNVCIWDILTGDCEYKFRFPSPVLKVQFHPRDNNKFLVCPMKYAAVLVEIGGSHKLVPLDQDVSRKYLMLNWISFLALFSLLGGPQYHCHIRSTRGVSLHGKWQRKSSGLQGGYNGYCGYLQDYRRSIQCNSHQKH